MRIKFGMVLMLIVGVIFSFCYLAQAEILKKVVFPNAEKKVTPVDMNSIVIEPIPSGDLEASPQPKEKSADGHDVYCLSDPNDCPDCIDTESFNNIAFNLVVDDVFYRKPENVKFSLEFVGTEIPAEDKGVCRSPTINGTVLESCYDFPIKNTTYIVRGVYTNKMPDSLEIRKTLFTYTFDVNFPENSWECAGAGIPPKVSW